MATTSSVSCQLYTDMTARVPTITAELMIQDRAPHCVNMASCSTSEVTRATSTPRRDPVWSARLSR